MNISSAIVIPHPDRIEAVRQSLLALADAPAGAGVVELHAVSPEGKMIVTLEAADDRETANLYEQISRLDGVLSASMVYHQHESAPETIISVEA